MPFVLIVLYPKKVKNFFFVFKFGFKNLVSLRWLNLPYSIVPKNLRYSSISKKLTVESNKHSILSYIL
jgi:hypothetical protein